MGLGSQGSPVFSELGKCWGFVITCHNDLPDKLLDPTVMSIAPPILPPSALNHNGGSNFEHEFKHKKSEDPSEGRNSSSKD